MRSRFTLTALLLAAALAACLPSAPTPDMNAALTQASGTMMASLTETASAPAPVTGTVFEAEGIRFVIPQGLAGGATAARIPAQTGADLPQFAVHPAYREITLVNYALGAQFHNPVIRVWPASEFGTLSEAAALDINQLQAVIANPASVANLSSLPFLPVFNAGQVFHAQTSLTGFTGGQGLRYLTLFSQFYTPIDNYDLFYTFQGLTNDGLYYVSVVLPVHAPILAATSDFAATVPSGGFAFPDMDAANFESLYGTYVANVSAALNGLTSAAYAPSLDALDALVGSIEILGP